MAITNHDRIGRALEVLRVGLTPFVDQEMKAVHGADWLAKISSKMSYGDDWRNRQGEVHLDAHILLKLMADYWDPIFRKTLGRTERNLVTELRDVRNDWAHQHPFSTDDVYRVYDSIARLLTAIAAPQAQEVEKAKLELLRLRFDEQARQERRKVATGPLTGQPSSGLKPWRQIVTPHPDVASGQYQQAEFAADLSAVYRSDPDTASEYRDPVHFFQRTYLTDGLRHLLETALLRLNGLGGNPVVELQTNFGGGKTHSMLALFHLFSGQKATELAGLESLLTELEIDDIPPARRVVIVGTALSPGMTHTHADGVSINTIWGEIAWQLGGAEGYAMLADADRHGVNPGSNVLVGLLKRYSPCLILLDEWVAHLRQLYHKTTLPAGSFDANLTFAQSLTEAAKQ
ncbi:MAG: ATP-binding protein, partial [Chloroflexi bacterium]|nr:ATP-binding protein [Chloroflexota bacterium]